MSVVEKHAAGTFSWVELGTNNSAAAKTFYSGLFGWQSQDMPMGPDQVYTMLLIDGKEVGALYQLDKDMLSHGVSPHWLLYISVASADETAARAKTLGATIVKEPFDVFDVGRMAVIQDPSGAVFAIWEARKHIGVRITGESGTLCWSELQTNDTRKALEFYPKLFGWSTKTGGIGLTEYTEIQHQGQSMGGVMKIPKEWGNVPAHWMPYFLVANCDSSADKAKQLGASILMGPMDIPNVGRFAVVRDPQAASFAIFQPAAH